MTALGNGQYVIALDGTGCDVDDVGGKAFGLDRLAFHSFPIPPSFAVTSHAYRRFIHATHLNEWLNDLTTRQLPGPDRLAAATAEVEHAFCTATIPHDVAQAIKAVAVPLLAEGPVAIRSSATAEDTDTASFAGQYRSYPTISSLPAVLDAVRKCWASLWFPAARSYRRRLDIDESQLAMGVVMQTTIDAEWSGVGFTVDPGGDPNTLRIEAVPEMGEALVSGAVTPLDYTVRRETLAIRSSEPDTTILPFLEDLARMLILVEDRLVAPQDVEWCYANGDLVLVQSRPITLAGPLSASDDGFDHPLGSRDAFTPHGVVEMLPGIVPPLLWTINAPMIEHGYLTVIESLGGSAPPPGQHLIGRFRGRAALNLSALRDVASSVPGGSPAELERQFLGTPIAEPEGDGTTRAGPMSILRARRAHHSLLDELELVSGAVTGILSLDIDITTLPARRLLVYRNHIRDLAWRCSTVEVAASSAGAAGYRQLEVMLGKWVDEDEAATWAQRLTAGGIGRDTAGSLPGRMVRQLLEEMTAGGVATGEVAAGTTEVLKALHAAPREDLPEVSEPLSAKLRTIARKAGSRSVYGGRTGEADLNWLWEEVWRAIHAQPPATSVDVNQVESDLRRRLTASRRWRAIRILTGQFVDLRIRWLLEQTGDTTAALTAREQAKTALLALGGEERRIIDEAARRLVTSHQLSRVEDVDYLGDTEMMAMLLGAPPPPYAESRRRRLVYHQNGSLDPLPILFTGSPDENLSAEVPDVAVLSGWAASPGITEATARVVMSLADAGRLNEGEILVAPSTDPSWTPVLLIAGGLVLETGGPLSHGAIVARELGIPAVLNVPHASRVIADGERIEVDGFAGVARRIEYALAEAGVAR